MKNILSPYADIAFLNGKVICVNKSNDIEEAVAVKENRIALVGSNEKIKVCIGPNTKVIDLKGRTLIPGFNDAHTHFAQYGMFQAGVLNNIFYTKVQSIAGILKIIREKVAEKKPGEWICFWGYDQTKVEEKRHPTIEELDSVAPNNPIQVSRCCGHVAIYNTLGLKKSKIMNNPNFNEEEVEKKKGKYTGLVRGNANRFAWESIEIKDEDILNGLKSANDEFIKLGVTSVGNQGVFAGQETRMFQEALRRGDLKIRVDLHLYDLYSRKKQVDLIYDYINTGVHSGFGNSFLKIGCVKILLDGSASAPSCALSEPYSHDPELKGNLIYTQEEINKIMLAAHLAGFQLTAHAIGDVATEQIINAIEYVLSVKPKENHRYRIEHAAIINPNLVDRMKNLGIIPVPNPGFFTVHTEKYNRFYGKRVNYMFPLKAYVDRNMISPIGSDFPGVEDPNPLMTLYGAVNRTTPGFEGNCGVEQKVTVLQAIKMHTYDGAYATFEEDIKGSIENGKLADIVVLSDNILQVPTDEIHKVKVDMTMINGEILYER